MSVKAAFIVPHPPLIVPQVGKGKEREIEKTLNSYETVGKRIAEICPETIILITPHSVMYSDYIHISPGENALGSLERFGANEKYQVKYDTELIENICEKCMVNNIFAGTQGEKEKDLDHGVIIPLHFINKYYKNYKIVRISLSGLSLEEHYKFGMVLNEAIEQCGRNSIIIASGDLSHKLKEDGPYGFSEEGVEFDKKIINIMEAGNFIEFFEFTDSFSQKAAECGLKSFVIMAGVLDKKEVNSEFLSYEGSFGVGYAVCAYEIIGVNFKRNFLELREKEKEEELNRIREHEDDFVKLARNTLETYVKTGKIIGCPMDLNAQLRNNKAGVFVSIKKYGALRGCIGTISPMKENIANEIIENAISSGTRDRRFSPITADELPSLTYSVDVLFPAESIKDKSELDVLNYGVIVENEFKRGLLLPNLEGVDTVDEQISIALSKAGIGKNEAYTMKRFKVVRHK